VLQAGAQGGGGELTAWFDCKIYFLSLETIKTV
jgi:hypothetical protein